MKRERDFTQATALCWGFFKRSRPDREQPDLFIFGVPGDFRGYKVGYSQVTQHNLFSWIILKSHTKNRDGWVRLRSKNPRDTPEINFNYFGTSDPDSANRPRDPDLEALAHGVEFCAQDRQECSIRCQRRSASRWTGLNMNPM